MTKTNNSKSDLHVYGGDEGGKLVYKEEGALRKWMRDFTKKNIVAI